MNLALPALERRGWTLGRTVAESRRGVKNFFKGFLRKPREELPAHYSGPRYLSDRLEAQTLLLADTCFAIGDFENAATHYRAVREDFRADRSVTHVLHCTLMLALCQCHTNPNPASLQERREHLDTISQLLPSVNQPGAPSPIAAYYALLGSELLISSKRAGLRSPFEAAQMLLQAAAMYAPTTARASARQGDSWPLLSALYTERASLLLLQVGKFRQFALQSVLAGIKYQALSLPWRAQASLCFTAALMFYETGGWGGIRSQLTVSVLEDVSNAQSRGVEVAQRSFLLMISLLEVALAGRQARRSPYVYDDAVRLLAALTQPGPWCGVTVVDPRTDADVSTSRPALLATASSMSPASKRSAPPKNADDGRPLDLPSALSLPPWVMSSTRDTLALSCAVPRYISFQNNSDVSTVEGLSVPELDRRALTFMVPMNGEQTLRPLYVQPGNESKAERMLKRLRDALATELQWEQQRRITQNSHVTAPAPPTDNAKPLGLMFALAEMEAQRVAKKEATRLTGGPTLATTQARVPLGEPIVVRLNLNNKLPVDVRLSEVRLDLPIIVSNNTTVNADEFISEHLQAVVQAQCKESVIIRGTPKQLGVYRLPSAVWRVEKSLEIKQRLLLPGYLLQDNKDQRAKHARTAPVPLTFEVVPSYPLLEAHWEWMSPAPTTPSANETGVQGPTCLEGELVWAVLHLKNLGASAAGQIYLKLDKPIAVWYLHTEAPLLDAPSSNYDAFRLSPCGQSGTITPLPAATTIAAKNSLRIGALLRFPRAGQHKLHLLVSYAGLQSDGSVMPFSPEQRCRELFLASLITALPSLQMTARIAEPHVACSGATVVRGEKQLTVQVQNVFSTIAADAIDSEYGQRTEGKLHVASVVAMGSMALAAKTQSSNVIHTSIAPFAAHPPSHAPDTAVSLPTVSGFTHDSSARECLTMNIPVNVTSPGVSEVCTLFSASAGQTASVSSEAFVVMCRLLAAYRSHCALQKAIVAAKQAVEADEEALQAQGPKSIAELRRENRALGSAQASATGASGETVDELESGGERDSVFAFERFEDLSLDDNRERASISNRLSKRVIISQVPSVTPEAPGAQVLALLNAKSSPKLFSNSVSSIGLTETDCDDALAFERYAHQAVDLARAETKGRAATIALLWTACARDGRTQWGAHWITGVPMLTTQSALLVDKSSKQASNNASVHLDKDNSTSERPLSPGGATPEGLSLQDTLLVRLTHASEVVIPYAKALSTTISSQALRATRDNVILPVRVHLRSVANVRTYVSIYALPFGKHCPVQFASIQGVQNFYAQRLRWQGKTSYLDIGLDPGQTQELVFSALFSGCSDGMYDLNSFRVIVSTTATIQSDPSTPTNHKESIVDVTDHTATNSTAEKVLRQPSLVSVAQASE